MPAQAPPRVRRWQAAAIIAMFFVAVAGAAAVGWWYALESPAHQGPIVLISVDGVPAAALPAYGAQRTDTPAIDALAAEAVVFDRAYAHTPQILPAHASIFTGLPDSLHGCTDSDRVLSSGATTLAEHFSAAGYETAGFF